MFCQGSIRSWRVSSVVVYPPLTCWESAKKHTRTMCQIFSKATEWHLVLLLSTLNIFLHFIIFIVEFNHINVGWAWETIFSDKFIFSNWQKYIVLWTEEICEPTYFHSFSPNLGLGKDKFSWQHFKKISQTLWTV